jgi:3'(2'), 5'-bisphosphate nucleotidase
VTVLIGISVKGESVGGVIHKPFAKSPSGEDGDTCWALKGLGSRGVKVRTTAPPRTTEEMSVVFTRSHYTDLVRRTVEALKPREEVRIGGCGNKTLMVVEGKVDAYVFPSDGTKKWDTCAVDIVVRSNGGLLTDVNGNRLDYSSWDTYRNKMGLVVSMCKETHQAVLDRIPQDVKDALASKL